MTASDIPILSGEEIVHVGLGIVNGQPLHYREWFNQLHRAGYAVAGKDPLAVVCANLHRHPLVKRMGDGIYGRDPDAFSRLSERILKLRQQVIDSIASPDVRDAAYSELRSMERIAERLKKAA